MAVIAPDIERLSPNVNSANMPDSCRTVIIHATRSGHSMNPSEFEGTLNYMQVPDTTSSHWVVGRDGTKARVVPDFRQAWHAGVDNDNAWGIEIEQGVEDDGFTDVQMAALVDICHGYVRDFGVPARHAANSTEGGFIGHQETAQGKSYGKSDPGSLFPWEWFIDELGNVPHPMQLVGIGVHYTDGSDEEVWTPRDGKTLDGIGSRYSDGSIERLYP